jgi:dCTP deaminase
MAIKADTWIERMAAEFRMIEPFSPRQIAGGISYGLSSYGYDLRIADEFKIFAPPRGETINPKSIPPEYYQDHRGDHCDIPPNGYILGRTVEYLRIPRDVLTLCVGKSTYARAGVLVNVTPFEPE